MSERENDQELRIRLIRAKDKEEVRAILGPETAQEVIDQAWREIEARLPADGLEAVDDDELEAVAGGGERRNWEEKGCADTVSFWSWCASNDMCAEWSIVYYRFDPCDDGDKHDWKFLYDGWLPDLGNYRKYECQKCGKVKTKYID